MGLLSEGTPLSWEDTKRYAQHVKDHGIKQFINIYKKNKDRSRDSLKFGDEVEYTLIKLDHKQKTARVLLKSEHYLSQLQEVDGSLWRPEYASYCIEASPDEPYGCYHSSLNEVEPNMKERRRKVLRLLNEGEHLITIVGLPRLGCPGFSDPTCYPNLSDTGASSSAFLPDETIFQGHPRFRTLTRNIRKRRGQKVAINVPIYKDAKTPHPFYEEFNNNIDIASVSAAKVDHVYMDCMGFGHCYLCLQVTMQGCDINEARHLYDQLTAICPIMLALTAASPVKKGYLTDVDTRWYVSSESCDDRTPQERGHEPLTGRSKHLFKTRFDSVDCYLSNLGERYNDIDLEYDEEYFQELVKSGVDTQLARHISHLFLRDPISIFRENIHQDDENETDHFENIQSTVWQSMRFKPPPPNSDIGWRVEFRPMEVQLTDFENAAFVVFIMLLTRTILSFNLNLLIPISKVDRNLEMAHERDAIRRFKFYFKRDMANCQPTADITNESSLMSVNTIMNGGVLSDGEEFPGLIPLIKYYLQTAECTDVETMTTLQKYLQFISDRSSGKLMTPAHWMRDFIRRHDDYQNDSVVSELINYDLINACVNITNGKRIDAGFLFPHKSSYT